MPCSRAISACSLADALNRVDPREFRIERLGAVGIDLLFRPCNWHRNRRFSARSSPGPCLIRRRAFQNLVQQFAISFRQFVEAAPARIRGRDGILRQPIAAGVVVEVLARLAGLIQDREFDAV